MQDSDSGGKKSNFAFLLNKIINRPKGQKRRK
jgi:hypothetical protein